MSGFSGTINIDSAQGGAEKLDITSATPNLPASATINIANGGTLFTGSSGSSIAVINAAIFVSGIGNFEILGALRVDGGSTLAGPITLQGDTTAGGNQTAGGTISGIINDINPVTSLSAGYGLIKVSTNTLTLSAANTYSGMTTIGYPTTSNNVTTYAPGGTLRLANTLAIQNSTLNIANGSLAFSSTVASHAFTIGGLTGTGNINLQDTASFPVALTIGNNNATSPYLHRAS